MNCKRIDSSELAASSPYGISFHWTSQSAARYGKTLAYRKAVERFRLKDFLASVEESGAGYVIFTTSHAQQFLPCPCEALDAALPGRTCERDLLMEIADGLRAAGKPLVVYYNHSCNHGDDPVWERAAGYHDANKNRLASNLCMIVSELGERYGEKAAGWWFDSASALAPEALKGQFPWDAFTDAAKTGFKDRLVTYNAGVDQTRLYAGRQDYWAGEMNDLDNPPAGPTAANGLPWHGWTCLDLPSWIWTGGDPEPPPIYDDAELCDFLRRCQQFRVPMCFNVAISQEGAVSSRAIAALRKAKSILGRFKSYEPPTAERKPLVRIKFEKSPKLFANGARTDGLLKVELRNPWLTPISGELRIASMPKKTLLPDSLGTLAFDLPSLGSVEKSESFSIAERFELGRPLELLIPRHCAGRKARALQIPVACELSLTPGQEPLELPFLLPSDEGCGLAKIGIGVHDELELEFELKDRIFKRGSPCWEGSCIELFVASAPDAGVKQYFLLPDEKSPSGGALELGAPFEGSLADDPPPLEARCSFARIEEGCKASASLSLKWLLKTANCKRFLLALAASVGKTDGRFVKARLFGTERAFNSSQNFASITLSNVRGV